MKRKGLSYTHVVYGDLIVLVTQNFRVKLCPELRKGYFYIHLFENLTFTVSTLSIPPAILLYRFVVTISRFVGLIFMGISDGVEEIDGLCSRTVS